MGLTVILMGMAALAQTPEAALDASSRVGSALRQQTQLPEAAFPAEAFAAIPADASPAAFVADRLAMWQERLGLSDWDISIAVTRKKDLKRRTLGSIHWDAEGKTAVLRVLDPSDYRLPVGEILRDLEVTIVHELVHLELSSLPHSEATRGHEEAAVNRIAEALLKLDSD